MTRSPYPYLGHINIAFTLDFLAFGFVEKPNKGCVWSVQSTEAELWDVWTDIRCNDGLLLMDSLFKSITTAGHCPGSSGGDHTSPPHLTHSYRGDLAGFEPATSETVRQRSYL